MREHDLNPRRRRRFTRTTDSDHDGPIFPFVAHDYEVHGPDQLWVADLTYVLDAWSRRVRLAAEGKVVPKPDHHAVGDRRLGGQTAPHQPHPRAPRVTACAGW